MSKKLGKIFRGCLLPTAFFGTGTAYLALTGEIKENNFEKQERVSKISSFLEKIVETETPIEIIEKESVLASTSVKETYLDAFVGKKEYILYSQFDKGLNRLLKIIKKKTSTGTATLDVQKRLEENVLRYDLTFESKIKRHLEKIANWIPKKLPKTSKLKTTVIVQELDGKTLLKPERYSAHVVWIEKGKENTTDYEYTYDFDNLTCHKKYTETLNPSLNYEVNLKIKKDTKDPLTLLCRGFDSNTLFNIAKEAYKKKKNSIQRYLGTILTSDSDKLTDFNVTYKWKNKKGEKEFILNWPFKGLAPGMGEFEEKLILQDNKFRVDTNSFNYDHSGIKIELKQE